MPLEWQLQVLERSVREMLGDACEFKVKPFWEVDWGSGEDLATQLVQAADGFPAVTIDGEVVCSGTVALQAVIEALQRGSG